MKLEIGFRDVRVTESLCWNLLVQILLPQGTVPYSAHIQTDCRGLESSQLAKRQTGRAVGKFGEACVLFVNSPVVHFFDGLRDSIPRRILRNWTISAELPHPGRPSHFVHGTLPDLHLDFPLCCKILCYDMHELNRTSGTGLKRLGNSRFCVRNYNSSFLLVESY